MRYAVALFFAFSAGPAAAQQGFDPEKFGRSVHKDLSCESCHSEIPPSKLSPVQCGLCHSDTLTALKTSAHGKTACSSCHGPAHEILKTSDPNSKVSRLLQPQTCGACHGEAGKVKSYLLTVHGELLQEKNKQAASCADCHGSHDIRPAGDTLSKVAHGKIASTCRQCHVQEAKAFGSSVHGKALKQGIREAPTCTDCHGEHTIRPPKDRGSSVWKGSITKTCSACHGTEKIAAKFGLPADRVQTFMDSFHGLAGKAGDLKAANCASCHGWHDVLPSSDPKSRIHPSNLAKTCGQCHPGAGARLASAKVHLALAGKGGGSGVADFFRTFYLIIIPLSVLWMGFHNAADFFRKLTSPHPLPPLRKEESVLMTLNERLQHGGLILCFLALAYTGFALKFPDSWWAAPLRLLGGEEERRTMHRAAALGFVFVGLFHSGYVAFSRKGKERLKAILPKFKDFKDLVALFSFNLGLNKNRPLLERFSYIEKAEYWALVWGSGVMVATGAVLIFHNFALAYFPLWVIETSRVIHYLEAVLACLAILVWHLYWVVYDPEVYPMNWAWLTGRSRLRK